MIGKVINAGLDEGPQMIEPAAGIDLSSDLFRRAHSQKGMVEKEAV
ncbi:hypothetical protein [Bradyrhizobium sp. CCBAU 45384]|nr:hypothetical protein [Bradyrhizobium sp. CCBAU 45384]